MIFSNQTENSNQINGKLLLVIACISCFIVFGLIIGIIGNGEVRHVQIYLPETIRQTVIFEDDGTKTNLIGKTISDENPNPTIITRAGGYSLLLTVINQSESSHGLYFEKLNIQTKMLLPGQVETLVITATDGLYDYYDLADMETPLGTLRVVNVIPIDEFG